MHRLVTSPSAQTRLRFAQDALNELDSFSEAVILTPTRAAGDDFVRTYGPKPGRGGLHRLTLPQLALELGTWALADRGLTPVSGVAIEALIARTAYLSTRQDPLDYFDPVSDTVGFVRALGRTISELRLEGISPERLEHRGPSGNDLATLLKRYETELEEGRLADAQTIYSLALDGLSSGTSPLGTCPVILIDVGLRTEAEIRFVSALAGHTPRMVAVALPQPGGGLERLEIAIGINHEALPEEATDQALSRVRRYVFQTETPPETESDSSLVFFSATDEGRESIEIARNIQIASANHAVGFDDVAILLRNPDTYQPLIEDALGRAGIPAYYTRGSRRPNPSGRAFLALLACRVEGLSASRFAEYLSLGQVPIPDKEGAPPGVEVRWTAPQGELFPAADPTLVSLIDDAEESVPASEDSPVVAGTLQAPFNWERLLVDAAVIGGYDRWSKRLRGLEEELTKQIEEITGEEEVRREYIEKQRTRLTHLTRFALPVVDLLDNLPQAAHWKEWLDALDNLAARTLRHPTHVLAILAELRPMGEVGPVTVDEVVQVLTDRLSFLRDEPLDRRYGKVFVATISEAAGRTFDHVFLPGVSEGVFPRKALEDPLLLDEFRRELDSSLPTGDDRVREERFLLHIAAGAAVKRLFVSYPRMDVGQGRARVPSFYALDVLRAAEGRIPDLGELERRARQTAMSRLGWPSPNEPSDAVDDAEYDLATIGALRHQPRAKLLGRGRYLLDTNPTLARSLRARARRWRNFWSEVDGVIDPDPETLAALTPHHIRNRSYSPTALQQFAACPYRFLLYAIHRLHPREEAATIEQLDPLTRGSLFHAVQFRLLSTLREDGLLPVVPENLSAVRSVADRILNEVAAEYQEDLAPAIVRIWNSEIEDLRTDLGGWLSQRSEMDREWVPAYFEFAFGLTSDQERDPASRDEEANILDGVRLRGSIDLIEEHGTNGFLRIVDHKTGRALSGKLVSTGAGEILQPMLYALAAEALLGKTVATSELAFCTQRGDFSRVEVEVDEGSRSDIDQTVRLIEKSIEDGFFPAAPRPGACNYCDYRLICGPYEELRTGRKKKDRLEQLNRLRQMP